MFWAILTLTSEREKVENDCYKQVLYHQYSAYLATFRKNVLLWGQEYLFIWFVYYKNTLKHKNNFYLFMIFWAKLWSCDEWS